MQLSETSRIKVGDVIPRITLCDTAGKRISTDELLRKNDLVLFFFGSIEDKGSQAYLSMLNTVYDKLQEAGAEVLAITYDTAKHVQERLKTKALQFSVLIDSEAQHGVKFLYNAGNSKPPDGLFLTDKFHSLYKYFILTSTNTLPDGKEIVESIEFLEKQCPECGISDWPQYS
jgi:peroxiredoxin